MMNKRAEIGIKGELLAAAYLINNEYEVIEQNYRYKHAEIDIIAKKENQLIFVEVKTRTKVDFGFPEESVDEKKERKIREGAEQYLFHNDWNGDIRFDIISVMISLKPMIEHFEDVF